MMHETTQLQGFELARQRWNGIQKFDFDDSYWDVLRQFDVRDVLTAVANCQKVSHKTPEIVTRHLEFTLQRLDKVRHEHQELRGMFLAAAGE
jgi:hypothetical protein